MVASAHQRVTTARCAPRKRIRTSPCRGCHETPLSPHLPPRRLYRYSQGAALTRHSAAAAVPRKRIRTHPLPRHGCDFKSLATFSHHRKRLRKDVFTGGDSSRAALQTQGGCFWTSGGCPPCHPRGWERVTTRSSCRRWTGSPPCPGRLRRPIWQDESGSLWSFRLILLTGLMLNLKWTCRMVAGPGRH